MLAVLFANSLSIYNNTSLKSSTPSSSAPECQLDLDILPSAVAWAPDGTGLYLAAEASIRRYNSAGHFERIICCPSGATASLVPSADGTHLYYATNEVSQVRVSDGAIRKLHGIQHSLPTGISLSSDGKHLALYSESECVVHHLSSMTTVTLGGFQSERKNNTLTACAFHSQLPTRFLVGYGHHLMIYDITNPQTPKKTIDLSDQSLSKSLSGNDNIISISNSPFSDNLVAIGFSAGLVVLVESRKGRV